VQSHRAFTVATSACYEQVGMARSIHGETVRISQILSSMLGVKSVMSEAGKTLVQKKRIAIKRWGRLHPKAPAERRLSWKVSKRTSKTLQDCPNIGKSIESFIQDHSMGVDA